MCRRYGMGHVNAKVKAFGIFITEEERCRKSTKSHTLTIQYQPQAIEH